MKPLARFLFAVLMVCLACSAFAEIGDAHDVLPTPPEFVRVLKMEMGKDTENKLERKIGKGFVTVGGHSNSGRLWHYPNGLRLLADGFDYGRDGSPVLDTIVFLDWKGRLGDTKELEKYGFGIWGKLKRGMTQTECLQLLPKSLPKPTSKIEEISWTQYIKGIRRGKHSKFEYEALLRFTRGRLDSLLLSGYFLE